MFDSKKLLRNKKVIQEINRHKWLESEIAGYDIGYQAAAESWLKKHAAAWIAYHMPSAVKKSAIKIIIKPIKKPVNKTINKTKQKRK